MDGLSLDQDIILEKKFINIYHLLQLLKKL